MKENGQSDQKKKKKSQDVSFFIAKNDYSVKHEGFLSDLFPQHVLTVTLGPG